MAIVNRYYLQDLEKKIVMLPWQERGLSYTSTGYGKKIPTQWMVKLPDTNRWRRVYSCCFSNAGTTYVPINNGKDWVVII